MRSNPRALLILGGALAAALVVGGVFLGASRMPGPGTGPTTPGSAKSSAAKRFIVGHRATADRGEGRTAI